jgi:hypothetical protein
MKEPEPTKPDHGIPESDLPTHSPDGVDLTLIRWMLSLTPGERLQVLENYVRSVEEIRAFRAKS